MSLTNSKTTPCLATRAPGSASVLDRHRLWEILCVRSFAESFDRNDFRGAGLEPPNAATCPAIVQTDLCYGFWAPNSGFDYLDNTVHISADGRHVRCTRPNLEFDDSNLMSFSFLIHFT